MIGDLTIEVGQGVDMRDAGTYLPRDITVDMAEGMIYLINGKVTEAVTFDEMSEEILLPRLDVIEEITLEGITIYEDDVNPPHTIVDIPKPLRRKSGSSSRSNFSNIIGESGNIIDVASLIRYGTYVILCRATNQILVEDTSLRNLHLTRSLPFGRNKMTTLLRDKGSDITNELSLQIRYEGTLYKLPPSTTGRTLGDIRNKGCYSYDVCTGEIEAYPSILSAASITRCSRKRIGAYLNNGCLDTIDNRYQFSREKDSWS